MGKQLFATLLFGLYAVRAAKRAFWSVRSEGEKTGGKLGAVARI
ncbi:MAG: hypothetical protein RRZ65_07590 [Tannerellaceae bacterium]